MVRPLTSKGTVSAARLQLVANGSPTPESRLISPTPSTTTSRPEPARSTDLAIKTGGVAVHVNWDLCDQGRRRSWRSIWLRLTFPSTRLRRCCLRRACVCPAARVCRAARSRPTSSYHRPGHRTDHQRAGGGGQHPAGRLRPFLEDWRTEAGSGSQGGTADPEGSANVNSSRRARASRISTPRFRSWAQPQAQAQLAPRRRA
jgi:hypothetical protein